MDSKLRRGRGQELARHIPGGVPAFAFSGPPRTPFPRDWPGALAPAKNPVEIKLTIIHNVINVGDYECPRWPYRGDYTARFRYPAADYQAFTLKLPVVG